MFIERLTGVNFNPIKATIDNIKRMSLRRMLLRRMSLRRMSLRRI